MHIGGWINACYHPTLDVADDVVAGLVLGCSDACSIDEPLTMPFSLKRYLLEHVDIPVQERMGRDLGSFKI